MTTVFSSSLYPAERTTGRMASSTATVIRFSPFRLRNATTGALSARFAVTPAPQSGGTDFWKPLTGVQRTWISCCVTLHAISVFGGTCACSAVRRRWIKPMPGSKFSVRVSSCQPSSAATIFAVRILKISLQSIKKSYCGSTLLFVSYNNPVFRFFNDLPPHFDKVTKSGNFFLAILSICAILDKLHYGAVPVSTGCAECRLHAEDDRWPR